MTQAMEQAVFGRLEDFISFAKTGAKIKAEVDLRKQYVSQKVHPGDTEEMKAEVDMYLLTAIFAFNVGGDARQVSKIYVFGSASESNEDARLHLQIANARLKEDYKRLSSVNISLEERFF